MIFYSDKNVYEAAKERIRYLFTEMPDRKFAVSFSGGKDSTVVLHLCHEVAKEMGIPKIRVIFLDQELEAPQVVDYMRYVMHLSWVEPMWVQTYFNEWNSSKGEWFKVWGPGEQWAREKEPDSIHELKLDVIENFNEVMASVDAALLGENGVTLGGVRIEESPNRRGGLTQGNVYKGITWGRKSRKEFLTFYPIYDWSFKDVWYYIFSNHLRYCKLYNYYFTQKPLNKCRVSSFIHENSIQGIKYMKEISPKFYEALMRRVANVNTTVQSYDALWQYVNGLPPYFKDWDEYIYYIADHLTGDPKNAETLKKKYTTTVKYWRKMVGNYKPGLKYIDDICGPTTAKCILAEDYGISKLNNVRFQILKYIGEHEREIEKANQ